jgi:hypothetical protein
MRQTQWLLYCSTNIADRINPTMTNNYANRRVDPEVFYENFGVEIETFTNINWAKHPHNLAFGHVHTG